MQLKVSRSGLSPGAALLATPAMQPWLLDPQVSLLQSGMPYGGFPGAAFLWFLIMPSPFGCGLGEDFLWTLWNRGADEKDRLQTNGSEALGIEIPFFQLLDAELKARVDQSFSGLFGIEYACRLLSLASLFPEFGGSVWASQIHPGNRAVMLEPGQLITFPVPLACGFYRLARHDPSQFLQVTLTLMDDSGLNTEFMDLRAQLVLVSGDQLTSRRSLESVVLDSEKVSQLQGMLKVSGTDDVYLIIANTNTSAALASQSALARPQLSVSWHWR